MPGQLLRCSDVVPCFRQRGGPDEQHISLDPGNMALFSSDEMVFQLNGVADLIEKLRRLLRHLSP